MLWRSAHLTQTAAASGVEPRRGGLNAQRYNAVRRSAGTISVFGLTRTAVTVANVSAIPDRDLAAANFHFISAYSEACCNHVTGGGIWTTAEAGSPLSWSNPSPRRIVATRSERNVSASARVLNVREKHRLSTDQRTR
jgi:hypothetical protein